MKGINHLATGMAGELKAIELFKELAIEVITHPQRRCPYDFLVKKDGMTYAVNVKTGENFMITITNLRRLVDLAKFNLSIPAFLLQTHSEYSFFVMADYLGVNMNHSVVFGTIIMNKLDFVERSRIIRAIVNLK